MSMEFAVNYSPLLAELVGEGQVRVDRFKCPAWPDLVKEARRLLPVYIHFPLVIGSGDGCPSDDERKAPADLDGVAELLEESGTRFVNTHFIPMMKDYPDIPAASREKRHIERVISNTLRDLEPLMRRFGAERVLIEHVINRRGWLEMLALPEVIARLLEASGCGFLLDTSHARLAARNLGIDERSYTNALPVDRIREIHVTGLQVMEGELYERLMAAGDPDGFAGRMAGEWMDHLPMLDADWPELEWAAGRIHAGDWQAPWVIASEVGGVGGFWEMVTTRDIYLQQVPRMRSAIFG